VKRWAAIALVAGCALTSKSEPRELRYFTLAAGPAATATSPACGELRLGRVTAASHLQRAIERRVSAVELVPYDTLRWAESPAEYVRRAAARAVFARAVEQAVAGTASVLELEVVAFEETARGGGRVELRYQLRDDRRVIASGAVAAERAAKTGGIEATVEAISDALGAASEELADRVAPICSAR